MAPAILSLHYCSVHHLLFSLLCKHGSLAPQQIEHTFGEAMRLRKYLSEMYDDDARDAA